MYYYNNIMQHMMKVKTMLIVGIIIVDLSIVQSHGKTRPFCDAVDIKL